MGGSIKYDFLNYLNNNEFDKITNDMIQLVNDLFTIHGKDQYLLFYFLNEYNIIRWLLNLPNINVNIQDNKGFTPLHLSSNNKNNEIVKELINKTNFTIIDNNNKSILLLLYK